jgi:hypothetical protein
MSIFLDFVAPTVKAFFLFMTFDFVKVTIKSRFCVGSTINFVHYVEKEVCVYGLTLFVKYYWCPIRCWKHLIPLTHTKRSAERGGERSPNTAWMERKESEDTDRLYPRFFV